QHPALVHGADELLFGPTDGRIAKAPGLFDVAGERIVLRPPLVAGDHPGVSVHARAGQPDLPVAGVGAEEEDRLPRVAGCFHRIALLSRPVFIVADGEERAAAQQRRGAFASDVEVGGVRDVVAVPLEEARHQRLVPQHLPAAAVARVRSIEAHLDGQRAARIVQRPPAPPYQPSRKRAQLALAPLRSDRTMSWIVSPAFALTRSA